MTPRTVTRRAFAAVAVLLLLMASESGAQSKKLKIGVIYDYSGPLADGGSVDADSLRKAALEVDIPEGGTMLGFGGTSSAMAPWRARTIARFQSLSSTSTTSPTSSAKEPAAPGAGAAAAHFVTVRAELMLVAPLGDFCYGPPTLDPFAFARTS
jgi:hypothetical protein